MSNLKGWIGEIKTVFALWLQLDSRKYKQFHNLIIPGWNGTAQIDHLVVSEYGLFIVESKNKSGWIFGSEDGANWTQSLFKNNYPFQNPLRQTYRQKKVLARFLNLEDSAIHVVIYFVGNCKFKTSMPVNVIRAGLGRYIKRFRDVVLSQEQMSRIVNELELHMNQSTLRQSDHVRSLRRRRSSNTVCPSCGASLRLKVARTGSSRGTKFLGCEAYPKCRFTKSA
ncbi:NERD domain-containing protein [Bdellovibrio sp. HCB274]|uniref:nuclease-related domain-containing protein n=1 Tax=Bdellovibrio sp. HCB274 TaxID=3394361 RepID=UPI0039B618DA